MRIAILTHGRFHVLDLARELSRQGHSVRFYSMVPPWRTATFGLPRECNAWILPRVAHWFALLRARPRSLWVQQKFAEAFDRAVSFALEPCDVFIGMSQMSSRTAETARRKYGASIWIERSSRHILSQKAILDAIPGAESVPEFAIRRELRDYQLADRIVVLSKHCRESFVEYGFPEEKFFVSNVGVDLRMFQPTPAPPPTDPPTIVMAGNWCLRKGCDHLVEAWKQLPGVRLMHVGPVQDCPLPSNANFVHVPKVDQSRLPEIYTKAHVLALPSHEDGFGYVIPQALACGLRVVCSDRTGGEDVQEKLTDPSAISIVKVGDIDNLARELRRSLDESRNDVGLRDRLGNAREALSWKAYGERYGEEIVSSFRFQV